MSYSPEFTLQTDLALKAAGLSIWQLDSTSAHYRGDDRFQQLLGMKDPSDHSYTAFLDRVHPEERDQVNQAFAQALKTETSLDVTFRCMDPLIQDYHTVRLWGQSERVNDTLLLRGVAQQVKSAPVSISQELFTWLDSTSIGMALLEEHDLSYVTINALYATLIGKKTEELLGKPLLAAIPDLIGQEYKEKLKGVLASGTILSVPEVEVPLPSEQEPNYIDFTYKPHWNEDLQRYTQLLVLATDVTSQVRMRKELERQKAELEHVIQSAPVSIARLIGPDFKIATVNQAFVDISGKGPHILNKPLIEVMPEIENQPFLHLLQQVYETKETYEQKALTAYIMQEGQLQQKYFNVCYTPLLDDHQEVYGILCFSIDVTTQIRLQKRSEQSSQSLQNAVNLAQLGTWVIHIEEKVLSFSAAVSAWIGFTSALTFEKISRMDLDVRLLEQAYRKAVTSYPEGRFEIEFEVVNPQTQRHHTLYALGNTHFDEHGRATRIRGFVQDVSSQRKMQQVLEVSVKERTQQLAATNEELQVSNEELLQANEHLSRSNESLEQFAFIASHDLQEPLRKIRQFSDLIVKRYQREQYLDEFYLDRIRQSASRMSLLVSDLLTFSRISNATPQLKRVDLNQILERVQENLSVTLEETQAQLSVVPLPVIEGDAMQLEQLWQNLISNALKFSSKTLTGQDQIPAIQINKREINASELPLNFIAQSNEKMYYKFSIQDNGVGFDERYSERIFGVFQRLHGKTEFKGSGIGLAICQKVALNHGGFITAQSQVGMGALFEVYLPKSQPEVKG